ncbi:hypothetical protein CVS40_4024 [Lucilia cuprina]|nr:hypothetical protein CVS40_4024 [Lucilia cuprina]
MAKSAKPYRDRKITSLVIKGEDKKVNKTILSILRPCDDNRISPNFGDCEIKSQNRCAINHNRKKFGDFKSQTFTKGTAKVRRAMQNLPSIYGKTSCQQRGELWIDLANQLNACGPPSRDVAKLEKAAFVSPVEEQLAIICGIFQTVDGVAMAKTFATQSKETYFKSDVIIESESSAMVPNCENTIDLENLQYSPSPATPEKSGRNTIPKKKELEEIKTPPSSFGKGSPKQE